MKLYFSPASPFARKCRVLIREKGIELEEIRLDPLAKESPIAEINPLSQVPALVDDAGVIWNDSPLICARLDALSGAPYLALEGEARWAAQRREVIADGMLEAGVKMRLESLRPDGEKSPTWIARWRAGVLRSIDAAEKDMPAGFDLAAIAYVCALTWLDFRHPDLDWKPRHPKLAALQSELEARESFKATAPG